MRSLIGALLLVACGLGSYAIGAASKQAPDNRPACVYMATPPTLVDNQLTMLRCDINGRLMVVTTP